MTTRQGIAIGCGALLVGLVAGLVAGRAPAPANQAPAVQASAERAGPKHTAHTEAPHTETPVQPAPPAPTAEDASECAHAQGPRVLPWVHGHEEDPERVTLDPAGLTAALERLRVATDPQELDDLLGLLGQSQDVRVEVAALDLAQRGESALRRAAAFDLLDALDRPAALPLVLRALTEEDDPRVRCAALFALPRPAGARGEVLSEVGVRLRDVLTSDPHPEARRRAALALGDWCQAPAALPALVVALGSDPSPEVRAGVAFALEQARSNDRAVRAALLRALEDQGEDPLVRDNAWHALGASAPLSRAEEAAWLAFGAARGRQGLTGY